MTVADRIRLTRESLGMTQNELALRLGLSDKSSVSKIEKSGDDITLKNVERISKVLHVTPSYLMGWIPSPDDLPDAPQSTPYYQDEETAQLAQSLFEDKNMRVLFDAAKDSKPQDLQMAADLLKRLKETNPDG